MKTTLKLLAVLLFAPLTALRADEEPKQPDARVKPFVHPGLLHSREELELIKQKIAAGKEPWKIAWDKLRASESALLDYKPRPRVEVVRGPYNNPNIGSSEFSNDSAAAYSRQ